MWSFTGMGREIEATRAAKGVVFRVIIHVLVVMIVVSTGIVGGPRRRRGVRVAIVVVELVEVVIVH